MIVRRRSSALGSLSGTYAEAAQVKAMIDAACPGGNARIVNSYDVWYTGFQPFAYPGDPGGINKDRDHAWDVCLPWAENDYTDRVSVSSFLASHPSTQQAELQQWAAYWQSLNQQAPAPFVPLTEQTGLPPTPPPPTTPTQPPPTTPTQPPPPPPPTPPQPFVTLRNDSTPGATDFYVGERFTLTIVGAPNQPVIDSAVFNGVPSSTQHGTTDSAGRFSVTGQMGPGEVGAWVQVWKVGTLAAQPSLTFQVRSGDRPGTSTPQTPGTTPPTTGYGTPTTPKTSTPAVLPASPDIWAQLKNMPMWAWALIAAGGAYLVGRRGR